MSQKVFMFLIPTEGEGRLWEGRRKSQLLSVELTNYCFQKNQPLSWGQRTQIKLSSNGFKLGVNQQPPRNTPRKEHVLTSYPDDRCCETKSTPKTKPRPSPSTRQLMFGTRGLPHDEITPVLFQGETPMQHSFPIPN
jgi:hypothetical protein